MLPGNPRRFWETRARSLVWRINVGAWVERAAPAAFLVATPFAIALVALRRLGQPTGSMLAAFGVTLAVVALYVGWRVRAVFFSLPEALVLLESRLRLDTRLTAATAGLVPWPPAPADLQPVVRWRLGAPAGWLGATIALVALALTLPVAREATAPRFSGPAPSLLQTKEMLAALQDLKTADPAALEKLAERTAELARRPNEAQFAHSALEAADALRDQTAAAAAALGRNLESAAAALDAASNSADLKSAAARLDAALQGLRDGALGANPDLLAQLPGNLGELTKLTAAQRAQLAQQLGQAGQQTRGVAGAAGAGASVAKADGPANGGAGAGGEGGGEAAPLTLANQVADIQPGKSEGLTLGDLSRVSLGDKLGTTSAAHTIDPNAALGPVAAGAVSAPAQGGDAVWVNRLTPAERAALKIFFK